MMKHSVPRLVTRTVSIKSALEWAFGTEYASVDFDVYSNADAQCGVDTIWMMMQRGHLGCKVDGGGRSSPHSDAEIIASFVAALPESQGGARMAIQIATLARSGLTPDWMPNSRLRCVPFQWQSENQHGLIAVTENAQKLGGEGWQPVKRRTRKRGIVVEPVLYCPVRFSPAPSEVARARRNYLDWWGALLHLRTMMIAAGLRGVIVTREMPPLRPWAEEAA